jgi:DNA-binding PadR family transcriptional regulator
MGLLSRFTGELHNEKIYDLTDRGYERLQYLKRLVLERMDEKQAWEFLAKIERCRIIKQNNTNPS